MSAYLIDSVSERFDWLVFKDSLLLLFPEDGEKKLISSEAMAPQDAGSAEEALEGELSPLWRHFRGQNRAASIKFVVDWLCVGETSPLGVTGRALEDAESREHWSIDMWDRGGRVLMGSGGGASWMDSLRHWVNIDRLVEDAVLVFFCEL